MTTATHVTPNDFANASWEEILPRYDELAAAPLDAANADQWLADWSALEVALDEANALASIAYASDTENPEKEAAYLRFSDIAVKAEEQRVRLAGRLLDLGYERPDLETVLRRFRNERDIFRPENVPLSQQLETLKARYQRITGGMTAAWDGKVVPLTRLTPYVLDPNRDIRERAFRLSFAPYIAARDELADLFDEQIALRQQIARNAGFANYRDYAFRERNRFDYTPADCEAFHDAVAASVVPVIARRNEIRRTQLGLDRIRPWDADVDPLGRPPLHPFDTVDELNEGTERIFNRIDPAFGAQFATMRAEELLDLDSRTGKRPGGFCQTLEYRKRPFIFMNAAGIHRDLETLLHEGGHAFHAFEALEALPLTFQREPDIEMAEVASMSMELLSLPYLAREQGGFYSAEDARRAEIEGHERTLTSLAWVATIDAFQHWLYTHEGHSREERDAAWLEIFTRFDAGRDWSGAERERLARWYRQLHIFLYPFYYIEYAIARLGALQIWRNSQRDPAGAVADYRRALALGGSRPLPELFAAAGARFAFDHATIAELTALVEDRLAELGSQEG
jgi:oligoendopeptidase F